MKKSQHVLGATPFHLHQGSAQQKMRMGSEKPMTSQIYSRLLSVSFFGPTLVQQTVSGCFSIRRVPVLGKQRSVKSLASPSPCQFYPVLSTDEGGVVLPLKCVGLCFFYVTFYQQLQLFWTLLSTFGLALFSVLVWANSDCQHLPKSWNNSFISYMGTDPIKCELSLYNNKISYEKDHR